MIITCDKCHTRYDLDDAMTRNKPFIKVRCSKCNNSFKVHGVPETDVALKPEHIVKADWDKTISISNQKGGVAKTSTSMNLGVSLAMMGRKVLLVDFDVQANLTISMGYPSTSPSFFDILKSGAKDISEYILETKYENLSLLTSNSRMALLTKHYMHKPNYEFLLRDKLASISGRFDYIVIDTPPALGFCTLNALMASHCIIIPTPCEYLSLHGIHMIEDVIKIVQVRSARRIDYRILITMFNEQSVAEKVIFKKISNLFQNRVLRTVIDRDQKMNESQIVHLPVYHYEKECSSARQYQQLAREIAALIS